MNDKQVSFILCVNNELYLEEAIRYINELDIPEGYSIDILSIWEADSMAQGYNAAMQESDAKYKVYIHQDVFLINKHFLYEMIEVFNTDERIGMIGALGTNCIPEDGEWYYAWRYGNVQAFDGKASFSFENISDEKQLIDVVAIDGMFMATQYDIPWREDIFTGWDFYDISHSMEMQKAGYRVVVGGQKDTWCFHDIGLMNLSCYDNYTDIFSNEYHDLLQNTKIEYIKDELRNKQVQHIAEMTELMKRLFLLKQYEQLRISLESYRDVWVNNDLRKLIDLIDIYYEESAIHPYSHSTLFYLETWKELMFHYDEIRFIMFRMEHDREDERIELLQQRIGEGAISKPAIYNIAKRILLNPEKVLLQLEKA